MNARTSPMASDPRIAAALDVLHGPAVLVVGADELRERLARDRSIDRLVAVEGDDLLRLRYPDASFDGVVCLDALAALDVIDFPKGLHELRRVCRGTLVVSLPRDDGTAELAAEKIERWFPRVEQRPLDRWSLLIADTWQFRREYGKHSRWTP